MIAEASMVYILEIVLLVFMVATSTAIILTRNLFASVMLLGITSLLMATTFFILDAPDVALTEAAVGAGVSTVLLLATLALTTDKEKPKSLSSVVPMIVIGVLAAILVYVFNAMPPVGDPTAVIHHHVVPRYIEQMPQEIDVPNTVAATLASYRGYDTMGEAAVVFTAGIGVLLMLTMRRRGPNLPKVSSRSFARIRHHMVPRVVVKVLMPFLLLFALYVQFHGDYSPGGGFQAGAIFAAAFMLYALVAGRDEALRVYPEKLIHFLMALGLAIYVGTGLLSVVLGGHFLDYNVLAHDAIHGQHRGILWVELGVGITVQAVLFAIFLAFSGREQR